MLCGIWFIIRRYDALDIMMHVN